MTSYGTDKQWLNMATFVSGSLLQEFKSQRGEVAQAPTHAAFSAREPLSQVELSATILHFGYLQESVTSCVLTRLWKKAWLKTFCWNMGGPEKPVQTFLLPAALARHALVFLQMQ